MFITLILRFSEEKNYIMFCFINFTKFFNGAFGSLYFRGIRIHFIK
jgi:hypothetical protein